MADLRRIYIVFTFSEIGSYLDYYVPCLFLQMGWMYLFKETCQSPHGTCKSQAAGIFGVFCLWVSETFVASAVSVTSQVPHCHFKHCPVSSPGQRSWLHVRSFMGKQRTFKKHLPSKNTLHVAVLLRRVSQEACYSLLSLVQGQCSDDGTRSSSSSATNYHGKLGSKRKSSNGCCDICRQRASSTAAGFTEAFTLYFRGQKGSKH